MRLFKTALLPPLAWRCAGLLGATMAAAVAWTMPDRADLPLPAADAVEPAPPQPGNSATAGGAVYPGIDRYPLFYASRQPWVAATSAKKRDLTLPERYELTGIMLSHDLRTALLKSVEGGKTVALSEGQALDGWILRTIGAKGVHFEKDKAPVDLTFPALQSGLKSGRAPN